MYILFDTNTVNLAHTVPQITIQLGSIILGHWQRSCTCLTRCLLTLSRLGPKVNVLPWLGLVACLTCQLGSDVLFWPSLDSSHRTYNSSWLAWVSLARLMESIDLWLSSLWAPQDSRFRVCLQWMLPSRVTQGPCPFQFTINSYPQYSQLQYEPISLFSLLAWWAQWILAFLVSSMNSGSPGELNGLLWISNPQAQQGCAEPWMLKLSTGVLSLKSTSSARVCWALTKL